MINQGKLMEKKIYSLVLEMGDVRELSMQYAYCLDDAYDLSCAELKKKLEWMGEKVPAVGPKIVTFIGKSVRELTEGRGPKMIKISDEIEELKEVADMFKSFENTLADKIDKKKITPEIQKTPEQEKTTAKNRLIKQIIDSKDPLMFELNQDLFTPAEKKYIKSFLDNDVK